MNAEMVSQLSKPMVPNNTKRKAHWARNLFNDWATEVLKSGNDQQLVEILSTNSNLLNISEDELNILLCHFILSLRKQNGQEYTSGSLFGIVASLQKYLEMNGRKYHFLMTQSLTM